VSGVTVSVVVTAYNAEEHLAATLDALLAQTRPADEIVVVDDGSTDGTPGVIARYAHAVKAVRQPNGGHGAALNRGWAESTCAYVAQCDADDLWEPEKVARQVAILEAHPEVDVAFGPAFAFGALEGVCGEADPAVGTGVLDAAAFGRALFAMNFILPSTTLVRRSLMDEIGRFDGERFPLGLDYDFWLRAASAGATFFYDPEPLVRYRRHADQATARRLTVVNALHAVRSHHAPRIGDRRLTDPVQAADLFRIGRLRVDDDPRAARAAFAESVRRTTPGGLAVGVRSAAWVAILTLPPAVRRAAERAAVGVSRTIDALRGGRPATLP
jgi:glycosyltransferase involved in cell wall biosynthesis